MTQVRRLAALLMMIQYVPALTWADEEITLEGRTVTVSEPDLYDEDVPAPLIIALHGIGPQGTTDAFGINALAKASGALFAAPSGILRANGNYSWTATDACCGCDVVVEDSSYLRAPTRAARWTRSSALSRYRAASPRSTRTGMAT